MFSQIFNSEEPEVLQALDPTALTTVNGKGLWSNWTRSFKSPLLAFLDLLDNSIDATLLQQPTNNAKVDIQSVNDGLLIINNSSNTKPLSECLKIYDSAKEHNCIGENGVGLKQGCAALSDLSFIFSCRNGKLEMGIIAKALQKEAGCWLPSFHFEKSQREILASHSHIIPAIARELRIVQNIHEDIATCLDYVGVNILADIIWNRLLKYQLDSGDSDIFLVYLTKLKHESLLNDLASKLPRYYIHIDSIKLQLDGKPFSCAYWHRRLVEFTKFQVSVDKEHPIDTKKNTTSCYPLQVFVGFDPVRMGSLALLIYSRKSGRLIRQYDDARNMLGLSHSGSDYCQGMTVIVDDYYGMLPLTPSKQDIAFSEESGGDAHEHNFFSWIGAVSKLFWNFHVDQISPDGVDKKTLLTNAIVAHKANVTAMSKLSSSSMNFSLLQKSLAPLRDIDLSHFESVDWFVKKNDTLKKLTTIWTYHKKSKYVEGSDTIFRIPVPTKANEAVKKRKIAGMPQKRGKKQKKHGSFSTSAKNDDSSLESTFDNGNSCGNSSGAEAERRILGKIREDITGSSSQNTIADEKVLNLQNELEHQRKETARVKSKWKKERRARIDLEKKLNVAMQRLNNSFTDI